MKYPEYKDNNKAWVIRQSGVFQRYDTLNGQNFGVLFSPNPDSKAHRAADSYLLNNTTNGGRGPLWLHELLFETHVRSWRSYIATEEAKLLPMVSRIGNPCVTSQRL